MSSNKAVLVWIMKQGIYVSAVIIMGCNDKDVKKN